MESEKLIKEELLKMQKERGEICVSVIVPTHKLSPERRADKPEVDKALENARKFLEFKYEVSEIKPLLKSLDDLYKSIDFNHNPEGLGLYVSRNLKVIVQFPFPVEEKVMVGDNFELRDVVYKMNYAKPYFVLLLTEKEIKLFKGTWNILNEINDNNFPKEYKEEYIYNPPSRGTPVAGYAHVRNVEKEKSALKDIRFQDFFREVDESLNDYLLNDIPLILLGTEKELALFGDLLAHKKHIVSKIARSFNYTHPIDLATIAWPAMRSHLDDETVLSIKDFIEKIGEHLGISGVEEVWKAVQQGRGLKLLVEKDFRQPGFVVKDAFRLFLRPPQNAHRILADAVDDIIEMMLQKNGQVFFTDSGVLKDYGRIALITRY